MRGLLGGDHADADVSMTNPTDLVTLLRDARQELSVLCTSGRCCTIRERIDEALAHLDADIDLVKSEDDEAKAAAIRAARGLK